MSPQVLREPRPLDGQSPGVFWPKDRSVTTDDGAEIGYTFLGPPDAPTVALCAGFLCPDTWWRYLAPALVDAGHRVLLFHYRGVASSTAPRHERADTYTVARFAGDLRAIVEAEKLDDLALVGHSMGVQVMLEAYPGLRGRVRGLAALTGTATSPLRTMYDRGEFAAMAYAPLHRALAATPSPLLRAVWSGGWRHLPFLRIGQLIQAFGPRTTPELVESYTEHAAAQDPQVALKVAAAMHAHTAAHILPTIAVPMLFIGGARDPFCPPAHCHAVVQQVPGATLRLAPNGTHGTVLEYPELVNGWVLDFLARLEPARG